MNKSVLAISTTLLLFISIHACPGIEFSLPSSFYAEQYLSNSEGLRTKVRIWKLGDQIRIQPELPSAGGGYTLLDTTKRRVTVVKPDTKQIATFPHTERKNQGSVIDESFLYFDGPITLQPVEDNGGIVEYVLELPGRTLSFQFVDNGSPTTLKQITFVKESFWSVISWKFIDEEDISPELFSIPEDYSSLIAQ